MNLLMEARQIQTIVERCISLQDNSIQCTSDISDAPRGKLVKYMNATSDFEAVDCNKFIFCDPKKFNLEFYVGWSIIDTS